MDATPSERSVRLVVTDDCTRSRLTVFFRFFLAIPHLVFFALWSLAAVTLTFVVWLAVLFERRAPRPLHGFLAAYVRYATHLTAYLSFAADPYPGFTGQPGYAVDVEIDPPARQGRWSAGFRLVLAVPALLLSASIGANVIGSVGSGGYALLVSGGGIASVAAFLGWFACLVRGRMPLGLRDVGVYAAGYTAQTYAYLLLLTDRYPSSEPALVPGAELPRHPVRVEVTDTLERSRLLVLFRLLLFLPLFVWLLLWAVPASLALVVAWLVALVIGRVPRPLWRFLAAYVRFSAHATAFLYLVGGPFPGFTGTQGSYTIDLIVDEAGRQRRIGILFRLVLALPALLLSTAYSGVLLVVAVLAWFMGLFTGRISPGMRNLGAAAVRYNAQAQAYVCLVTDRYPYSAPFLRSEEHHEQLTLDGELDRPSPPGEPA